MPYKSVAILLLGALAGAMIASGAYTRWPDAQTALLGNVGWLPFGVAVATVAFLAVNSQVARKTLENTQASLDQSRRAEVGSRFQKALELLESSSVATRVGGIAVLRDVATDAPDEYWPTVVQVLVHLIEASTKNHYEKYVAAIEYYEQHGDGYSDTPPEYGATQQDVVRALEVLGLKAAKLRAAVLNSRTDELIVIRRCALIGIELRDLVLTHVEFDGVYAQDLELEKCICTKMTSRVYGQSIRYTDCDINAADLHINTTPWGYDGVTFDRCDLARARIYCRGGTPFRIEQCNVDGTRIAVDKIQMKASWWMDRPPHQPEDFPPRKNNIWDAISVSGATPIQSTDAGFPIYRRLLDDEIPF